MKAVYVLSIILLLYTFLRIKKSSNNLNLILWLSISIILFMSFNSTIIFIISILGFKATILIRTIINILLSIIFFIISRKNKQKYKISYQDIIYILLILVITFIITLFRFGPNLNLDFEMTDAITHFHTSKVFSEESVLVEYTNTKTIMYDSYKGCRAMFFSYTNMGTLFQVLGDLIGKYSLYKLFIIFELFSFMIGGILFYYLIKREDSSIKNEIFTFILVFMYMLGYPLLNLIYGFHYWGLYLLIVETILLLSKEYFNKNNITIMISLSMLMFILFAAYYMMIPVIYGAYGLYILYLWKVQKKSTLKKSIINIAIILVIPFIIGMIYFIILPTSGKVTSSLSAFSIDGANYNNIVGNFILFIPLLILYFKNNISKKKLSLESFIFIIALVYTIILFIFMILGSVSIYYYSKMYNLLWLLTFIFLSKSLYTKNKDISYIIITLYFIIVILNLFNVDKKLTDKGLDIGDNVIISKVGNIYSHNASFLLKETNIISKDKYELILEVLDNYDKYKNIRGEVPMVATYFQKMWIAEIFDIIPSNNYSKKTEFYINNISIWESDPEIKYIVWIYNRKSKDKLDLSKYNILYSNNAGFILEKNY